MGSNLTTVWVNRFLMRHIQSTRHSSQRKWSAVFAIIRQNPVKLWKLSEMLLDSSAWGLLLSLPEGRYITFASLKGIKLQLDLLVSVFFSGWFHLHRRIMVTGKLSDSALTLSLALRRIKLLQVHNNQYIIREKRHNCNITTILTPIFFQIWPVSSDLITHAIIDTCHLSAF